MLKLISRFHVNCFFFALILFFCFSLAPDIEAMNFYFVSIMRAGTVVVRRFFRQPIGRFLLIGIRRFSFILLVYSILFFILWLLSIVNRDALFVSQSGANISENYFGSPGDFFFGVLVARYNVFDPLYVFVMLPNTLFFFWQYPLYPFTYPVFWPVLLALFDCLFFRPYIIDSFVYRMYIYEENLPVIPDDKDEESGEYAPLTWFHYFDYPLGYVCILGSLMAVDIEWWSFLTPKTLEFQRVQIMHAWDVPLGVQEVSRLRLTQYRDLYRGYRHLLLTQVHNYTFLQTYLDVLQLRYGPTVGQFFFQTPHCTTFATPEYHTQPATSHLSGVTELLADTRLPLIERIKLGINEGYPMQSLDHKLAADFGYSYPPFNWVWDDFLFFSDKGDYYWRGKLRDKLMFKPHFRLKPKDKKTSFAENPLYFLSNFVEKPNTWDPEVMESRYVQHQRDIRRYNFYNHLFYAYKPRFAATLDFLEQVLFGDLDLTYFSVLQHYMRPRYDTNNYLLSEIVANVSGLRRRTLFGFYDYCFHDTWSSADSERMDHMSKQDTNWKYPNDFWRENPFQSADEKAAKEKEKAEFKPAQRPAENENAVWNFSTRYAERFFGESGLSLRRILPLKFLSYVLQQPAHFKGLCSYMPFLQTLKSLEAIHLHDPEESYIDGYRSVYQSFRAEAFSPSQLGGSKKKFLSWTIADYVLLKKVLFTVFNPRKERQYFPEPKYWDPSETYAELKDYFFPQLFHYSTLSLGNRIRLLGFFRACRGTAFFDPNIWDYMKDKGIFYSSVANRKRLLVYLKACGYDILKHHVLTNPLGKPTKPWLRRLQAAAKYFKHFHAKWEISLKQPKKPFYPPIDAKKKLDPLALRKIRIGKRRYPRALLRWQIRQLDYHGWFSTWESRRLRLYLSLLDRNWYNISLTTVQSRLMRRIKFLAQTYGHPLLQIKKTWRQEGFKDFYSALSKLRGFIKESLANKLVRPTHAAMLRIYSLNALLDKYLFFAGKAVKASLSSHLLSDINYMHSLTYGKALQYFDQVKELRTFYLIELVKSGRLFKIKQKTLRHHDYFYVAFSKEHTEAIRRGFKLRDRLVDQLEKDVKFLRAFWKKWDPIVNRHNSKLWYYKLSGRVRHILSKSSTTLQKPYTMRMSQCYWLSIMKYRLRNVHRVLQKLRTFSHLTPAELIADMSSTWSETVETVKRPKKLIDYYVEGEEAWTKLSVLLPRYVHLLPAPPFSYKTWFPVWTADVQLQLLDTRYTPIFTLPHGDYLKEIILSTGPSFFRSHQCNTNIQAVYKNLWYEHYCDWFFHLMTIPSTDSRSLICSDERVPSIDIAIADNPLHISAGGTAQFRHLHIYKSYVSAPYTYYRLDQFISDPVDENMEIVRVEPRRALMLRNAFVRFYSWLTGGVYVPLDVDHVFSVRRMTLAPRSYTAYVYHRTRYFARIFDPIFHSRVNTQTLRLLQRPHATKTTWLNTWARGFVWDVPPQIQAGALHYAWPFAFDRRGLVPVEWFYSRMTRNDFSLTASFIEWWLPRLRFVQLCPALAPFSDWHKIESPNTISYLQMYHTHLMHLAGNRDMMRVFKLLGSTIGPRIHSIQQLLAYRMGSYYQLEVLPRYIDLQAKFEKSDYFPKLRGSWSFYNQRPSKRYSILSSILNLYYDADIKLTREYGFRLLRYYNMSPYRSLSARYIPALFMPEPVHPLVPSPLPLFTLFRVSLSSLSDELLAFSNQVIPYVRDIGSYFFVFTNYIIYYCQPWYNLVVRVLSALFLAFAYLALQTLSVWLFIAGFSIIYLFYQICVSLTSANPYRYLRNYGFLETRWFYRDLVTPISIFIGVFWSRFQAWFERFMTYIEDKYVMEDDWYNLRRDLRHAIEEELESEAFIDTDARDWVISFPRDGFISPYIIKDLEEQGDLLEFFILYYEVHVLQPLEDAYFEIYGEPCALIPSYQKWRDFRNSISGTPPVLFISHLYLFCFIFYFSMFLL